MKKLFGNVLKYSIILILTGYLLYDAFTSIDESQLPPGQSRLDFILGTWLSADKMFLILCGITSILSHLLRAARWILTLEPIGYKVPLSHSFNAVMNSYFINLFVPRGGEISRPLYIKKLDKVPVEVGIGTVVTERIIDLLFLLICIGTVFLFQLQKFSGFLAEIFASDAAKETSSPIKFYILGGVLTFFLFIWILLTLLKKFKPELVKTIVAKVLEIWSGLKNGLTSIFKLEKRALFIGYSLGIWLCYYLMLYFFMLAIPETSSLGLMDALTIFVVGGIAMALPMPGGTGSYHFLIPIALKLLCDFDNENVSVVFATLNHAWITSIVILVGGYSLIFMSRKSKQLEQEHNV